MPLICVYSPKGGVGKTTLAANVCHSFSAMGLKAIALDMDPQNALKLHFGIPLEESSGFAANALESALWSKHLLSTNHNVFVLPFGAVTPQQRLDLDVALLQDPIFVERGLDELLEQPELVVVADIPTGQIGVLNALLPKSDVLLIPLSADTASLSLLPTLETLIADVALLPKPPQSYVVINHADYRRKISKDVESFLSQRLANSILGVVHRDESVVEANAAQKSIVSFNRASVAAFDIDVISKKIAKNLGLLNDDGSMFSASANHRF